MLAATAGALLFGARSSADERAPTVLRIGLLATAHDDLRSVERGVALGATEAQRVAALLGRELVLISSPEPDELISRDSQVLVGGLDEASYEVLSGLAAQHRRVFFNIGCPSDVLRGMRCRRTTFHIIPSDAMRRDAIRLVGPEGDAPDSIEAWHGSLERYGAAQLNHRFRAEYGASMDSAAWNAWMAVKIAWETAARVRGFETARVIAWLEDARTRFDGHKGRALSFRSWDHQMRQPLYRLEVGAPDSIVEIPLLERRSAASVADQLDRIGTTAERSSCRWESS